jgi:membrane-bound inhibitor of C-type lysozyme
MSHRLAAALTLATTALLPGCTQAPMTGGAAAQAASPAAAPPGASPARRDVNYRCEDGQALQLRFFPQHGVAVLVRDGQTLEMQQEPAASGFLYRAGQTVVRGQGNEMRLEIARRAPVVCRAG